MNFNLCKKVNEDVRESQDGMWIITNEFKCMYLNVCHYLNEVGWRKAADLRSFGKLCFDWLV